MTVKEISLVYIGSFSRDCCLPIQRRGRGDRYFSRRPSDDKDAVMEDRKEAVQRQTDRGRKTVISSDSAKI